MQFQYGQRNRQTTKILLPAVVFGVENSTRTRKVNVLPPNTAQKLQLYGLGNYKE